MTNKQKNVVSFLRQHWVEAVLILLSVTGATVIFVNRDYGAKISYLSGDEPHYVMMADSLVEDRDFNLKNDYELDRSQQYYPGPSLLPHNSPLIDEKSDKWYSIHTIGLPFIIALPYEIFGLPGARIWIMILQMSLILTFYLLLRKHIKTKERQRAALALLVVCPLFWQNLGSLFPDLILANMAVLAVLFFGRKGIWSNSSLAALFVGATLVHSKGFVLLAPLVLAHAAWLIYSSSLKEFLKRYALPAGIIIVGGLLYVYFLHRNYGVLSPSQIYGNNGQLFAANPVYNLVAMLSDRSKGLLVHFPLLLVALPYLVAAVFQIIKALEGLIKKTINPREQHFLLIGVLSGLGLSFVTIVGFFDWSGSTAPNGRSVLPFVLVIIFVVAKYINLKSVLERTLLAVISVLCLWLTWLSITDFKYYMSTGVNSFWVDRFSPLTNLPLFNLSSIDYGRPPLVRGGEILAVILIFNVILTVLYFYRVSLKRKIIKTG